MYAERMRRGLLKLVQVKEGSEVSGRICDLGPKLTRRKSRLFDESEVLR